MKILTATTTLPSFIQFPKFLMKEDGLTEFEKIVYCLLLDKVRLSMLWNNNIDENGNVFCIYPIKQLSTDLKKSETTIKNAVNTLKKAGYLKTIRQGLNKPNKIYVLIPDDVAEN